MPIYEYKCPLCERKKEIFQKMDEAAPKCSGHPESAGFLHSKIEMKKQLGPCLVYFGRRGSYRRNGYSDKNVVLQGGDGHRVMAQSRMRPGDVRCDNDLTTKRGEPKFES